MHRLPDDLHDLLLGQLDSSLEYYAAILGESHPLLANVQRNASNVDEFIDNILAIAVDTRQRFPYLTTKHGAFDPEHAVLNSLKYTEAVTGRYAAPHTALSIILGGGNKNRNTFRIFEYQIGGETKKVRLHVSLPYHSLKKQFFGNQPASAIKPKGTSVDMILLEGDPDEYFQELKDLEIIDFIRALNDGELYLPEGLQDTLQSLDFIMFHRYGAGNMYAAFHPNNGDRKCGDAIIIPTLNAKTWLGQRSSAFRQNNLMTFAHELQHGWDEVNYPSEWGEMVWGELRAFLAELDTATHYNWHGNQHIDDLKIFIFRVSQT